MIKRAKRHNVVQPRNKLIRLIPLTRGLNTIVDASDYEFLNQWDWCALKQKDGRVYVCRRGSNNSFLYMHRVLTNNKGIHTDHKDHNTLNNRRSNLRPCTRSQNGSNRGKQKGNTSGYKGVYCLRKKYWHSQIKVDQHKIHLGYFDTPKDAAHAYDKAALKYFGEFAYLNFFR